MTGDYLGGEPLSSLCLSACADDRLNAAALSGSAVPFDELGSRDR
jgi:hypothetical protein